MAAKEFQVLKEAKKVQKQQNIINKKVIAAANKQKKEVEKLERAKTIAKRRLVKAAEMQL